jgi:hypothetical protein
VLPKITDIMSGREKRKIGPNTAKKTNDTSLIAINLSLFVKIFSHHRARI